MLKYWFSGRIKHRSYSPASIIPLPLLYNSHQQANKLYYLPSIKRCLSWPQNLCYTFKTKFLKVSPVLPSLSARLHGVRFYRHFFGFIFITLVVAFDTVDRSLSLKILPSPRFCETHPPRLFLLPLWPFLSQVPSLVPLLLLHSQHQGFFVLFCFVFPEPSSQFYSSFLEFLTGL